jgi:hypothetical protein
LITYGDMVSMAFSSPLLRLFHGQLHSARRAGTDNPHRV